VFSSRLWNHRQAVRRTPREISIFVDQIPQYLTAYKEEGMLFGYSGYSTSRRLLFASQKHLSSPPAQTRRFAVSISGRPYSWKSPLSDLGSFKLRAASALLLRGAKQNLEEFVSCAKNRNEGDGE
jgi:hypothetical protein